LGLVGTLLLYGILRLQRFLPWFYPAYQTTPVTLDLAMNTAIGFSTTTTWQAYGGENTLRYASQMIGLTVQNFLAGASGLAVGVAFIQGFAGIAIEAQHRTIALVEFPIDKAKLLDRLRGQLNERQEKVLLRMFREGLEGFRGGLAAGKYSTITGASPARVTRDLADLVAKGAPLRVGERRHARYDLGVPLRPVKHVTVNERGEPVES
jgi:hypothetical protein